MKTNILVKAKTTQIKPMGGVFCIKGRHYKLSQSTSKYYTHQYNVYNTDGKLMGLWTSNDDPKTDRDFHAVFTVICQFRY